MLISESPLHSNALSCLHMHVCSSNSSNCTCACFCVKYVHTNRLWYWQRVVKMQNRLYPSHSLISVSSAMVTEGEPSDWVKVLHLLVLSFPWGMQVWVSFVAGERLNVCVSVVMSNNSCVCVSLHDYLAHWNHTKCRSLTCSFCLLISTSKGLLSCSRWPCTHLAWCRVNSSPSTSTACWAATLPAWQCMPYTTPESSWTGTRVGRWGQTIRTVLTLGTWHVCRERKASRVPILVKRSTMICIRHRLYFPRRRIS